MMRRAARGLVPILETGASNDALRTSSLGAILFLDTTWLRPTTSDALIDIALMTSVDAAKTSQMSESSVRTSRNRCR